LDKLDDEQFPGMVYAKIKMYNSKTTDNFDPQRLFLKRENYIKYIL
jgi:hypothetical protein